MASRNFIVNNFGWKLLSLLLAAMTWLAIEADFQKDEIKKQDSLSSPVTSQRTLAVPLAIMTSATGTNRFKTTPLTVAVEISGNAEELSKTMPADIDAWVDATDAGDETTFFRKVQFKVPRDVTFKKITPERATVERITGPK